jgi:ectoine hydroxylase-related dioxygenase (phytanoyl-CoA dioxygenase family)
MENLHLDMNPWRPIGDKVTVDQLDQLSYDKPEHFLDENNLPLQLPGIQMLVNLADNKAEDGGLQVVPRFPREQYADWVDSRRTSLLDNGTYDIEDNFIRLDDDDPVHLSAVRVTARAGSLIVWDKRMIHGSKPNLGNRFRYAQFFLMFPAKPMDPDRANRRQRAVVKGIATANIQPSSLPDTAKRLFGILPY